MKAQRETQLLKVLARKYASDDYDAYDRRRDAIDALGGATSDRAFNRLVDVFTHPVENYDRQRALDSIVRMRPDAALPYILSALGDEDKDLRSHAALAVGDVGAVDAAPLLQARLRDPDWGMRSASAESLGKLRYAPAVPDLIALTRDPDPYGNCRIVATIALGEIATPEADEALMADHIEVRWVWPHLIRIGDRRALPRMRKWLKQGGGDCEDAREWTAGCGEPSLEKIVRDWEKHWRTKVRPKRNPARWGERAINETPNTTRPWREEVLEQLHASGWLDQISAREAARIKRALSSSEQWDATLLSPAGFDVECIENSGDYKRWVISAYQKAASGALKFTNVKDVLDDENEVVTLSFRVGRKTYTRTFDQPDDYVSEDLNAFMNKVASDAGLKQRFYELETGDQIAALAFVTPPAFKRARRLSLI